ncbi:penicillin-binding protein, partial [Burkholderia glumae]|nr:penicillin-binding protein [Burkholderia glumae]
SAASAAAQAEAASDPLGAFLSGASGAAGTAGARRALPASGVDTFSASAPPLLPTAPVNDGQGGNRQGGAGGNQGGTGNGLPAEAPAESPTPTPDSPSAGAGGTVQ